MNLFRLCGDVSHVVSIVVLALRLNATKSAVGISLKTQELYLVVFVARYADLFSHFYSYYNTLMKIAFITSTAAIIYTVRFRAPWKHKYDRSHDTFKHWLFAVLPSAVVAVLYTFQVSHHSFRGLLGLEILWNFSIILEPLAIVPQLFVLQRFREIENLTAHYVFFLGLYRLMYIFNWIWRSGHEAGYHGSYLAYFCGFVQTLLYGDFFYYFSKAKATGSAVALPT